MVTTETISVYTVLEKLIRYSEKKKADIKIINFLKERKNLDFLKDGRQKEMTKSIERAMVEVKSVREFDERKAREEEVDVWFQNLTILQQNDVALNLWCSLSFKDKEKQYKLKNKP